MNELTGWCHWRRYVAILGCLRSEIAVEMTDAAVLLTGLAMAIAAAVWEAWANRRKDD